MKTIAALAAVLAMAQPAMAATSLCIEDVNIGLAWENGAWKPVQYGGSRYVIRKAAEGEQVASSCFASIKQDGDSLEPVETYGAMVSHGCYVRTAFGTPEFMADGCTEYWDGDEIELVSCNDAFIYKYGFRPAGEFYIYTTGSITAGKPGEIPDTSQRQPAFMSVGQCSVITP